MSQAGEKIRVLIIDDIAETRENLRKLLSFDSDIEVVAVAGSGPEGIELVKQYQPHVVVMDINMPGMDGITATELIIQAIPATQVVMLSVQGETDYLRRAMLAGARDFLTKPPSGDELMSTLRRVYETGKTRAAMMVPVQADASRTGSAKEEARKRAGNLIAVFSPKGGVGCTTIATNLAIALQEVAGDGQKVALVDASLQFGGVGVMLDLRASRSMADLVSQLDDMDSDMLSSVLTPHGSGVKVLLAPPHPEAAESLLSGGPQKGGATDDSAFGAILGLVTDRFDYTVADMWSRLDDISLSIFDAAAVIVLVVTPTIPSVKSARLFLEVANQLNYPTEKVVLVVNKVSRHSSIRAEQIEQAMVPVAVSIPLDDQGAMTAANQGVPFVVRDRNRPVSQSIVQLAQHIEGMLVQAGIEEDEEEDAAVGTGRRRLRSLFG